MRRTVICGSFFMPLRRLILLGSKSGGKLGSAEIRGTMSSTSDLLFLSGQCDERACRKRACEHEKSIETKVGQVRCHARASAAKREEGMDHHEMACGMAEEGVRGK